MEFKRNVLSAAIATAIAAGPATAVAAQGGEYRSGDFHNHTSCSDGSTSVRTLTRAAIETYGHDWFIHVGHSGRGPRDCRIDDFLYHALGGGSSVGLWTNTLEPGDIKGDERTRDFKLKNADGSTSTQTVADMWRWQSLQEYNLPQIVEVREEPQNSTTEKVAFLGLEWVVPGHEHASNSIISGQYDSEPNADALAQFEYCFARNSDDTSQGGGQGWTCEISEANNQMLIDLFDGRPEEGVADYNSTLVGGINTDDAGEHVKAAAATLWMQENFPGQSFTVQAHVERQGAFIEDDDEGWNVEHMRDMHSLAPDVAFGFESQPGHQAQYNRGSYNNGRPTAGLFTYGGTGAYAAAEVTKPGLDFDGNPLEQGAGGYEGDMNKVVLSRPGVRTMWDALLSEGRKFYFYGSSDWHNRGAFGPTEPESTNDFWPGEYQDNFTYIVDNNPDNPAQDIVDGLRSGNVFVVQGQLIDKMQFTACAGGQCATMGETLNVRKGRDIHVTIKVRDPAGESKSPYTFNNPALTQIGVYQPLNKPELAHIEFIAGDITGYIPPTDENYFNPLAPETTRIVYQDTRLGTGEEKSAYFSYKADKDGYVRARGSNLPPGTPYKRDMDGNPLSDDLTDNIPCDDELCPPHLDPEGTGQKILNADVEAWADIWFYANPIFINVIDDEMVGDD
jgi:hypothetical protein